MPLWYVTMQLPPSGYGVHLLTFAISSVFLWPIEYGRSDIPPTPSVLVCSGCHNKIPQIGSLQQQELIFSRFWRTEVQDQGAIRIGFWWDLTSWLADSCFHTVSPNGLSSVVLWREGDLWCLRFFLEGRQSYQVKALPSWTHLIFIAAL